MDIKDIDTCSILR